MATSPSPADDEAVVLVVFGGPTPVPEVLADTDLSSVSHVVAADRGLEHALALGLAADVVVGDLDSVDPEVLAAAESGGVRVQAFSADKVRSDLELALEVAAGLDPSRILVVGSGLGRLDHVLVNLAVLGDRSLHHMRVSARFDHTRIAIVAPGAQRTLWGKAGDSFTVLALGSDASGVCISGARWPLTDARLSPTEAVGLSNEFLDAATPVEIACGSGTLAVIQAQD